MKHCMLWILRTAWYIQSKIMVWMYIAYPHMEPHLRKWRTVLLELADDGPVGAYLAQPAIGKLDEVL